MAHRLFLIKPASGFCNMRCSYCFYADEMKERTEKDFGMMTEEVARTLIDRAFDSVDSGALSFAFQGGEPTTRGLEFFRFFVSYVEKRCEGRNILVNYAIQTNGMLVDRKWAAFFKENSFLVGVSLDSMRRVHDTYRKLPGDKGSFRKVMRAVGYLKEAGVEFNILSTVNRLVSMNAQATYLFFKRNGLRHLQFIPCIDFIADKRGSLPWSLDAAEYGTFLVEIFKLYYEDWRRGDFVSVRYFDNLVTMLCGQPPEACGMAGVCGNYYLVEGDGGVYPCDFYVLDGYCMGNITTDTIEQLDKKRDEIGFIEKSKYIDPECRKCEYFGLCRGGCRRDRENFFTGELERSYLCEAYTRFFKYALPYLKEMAQAEIRARQRGF